ncbi:MAG: hypothetical protein PVJ22_18275, partial [Desulfobacterales bacterium]
MGIKSLVTINIAANVLWGISLAKAIMAVCPFAHQGKVALAYETSDEAIRIANESGDIYSKAHAYPVHGWCYYYKGYLQRAKEHLLKGAVFSDRINHLIFIGNAHCGLGITLFDMKDYINSRKHFEMVISLYRNGSFFPSLVNYCRISSALAKVMENEKDINLDEIFKWYKDIKYKWVKGTVLNHISQILLNIDDQHISEAE